MAVEGSNYFKGGSNPPSPDKGEILFTESVLKMRDEVIRDQRSFFNILTQIDRSFLDFKKKTTNLDPSSLNTESLRELLDCCEHLNQSYGYANGIVLGFIDCALTHEMTPSEIIEELMPLFGMSKAQADAQVRTFCELRNIEYKEE